MGFPTGPLKETQRVHVSRHSTISDQPVDGDSGGELLSRILQSRLGREFDDLADSEQQKPPPWKAPEPETDLIVRIVLGFDPPVGQPYDGGPVALVEGVP